MSTGVTCQVFIDGVKAADGTPGESPDEPAILDDLEVVWGRSDTMSQPDPDTCTFTVVDPVGGQAFTQVYGTGRRVDVVAHGMTYPDPSAPTFINPGIEGPEVTWAAEGGTATVTTHRFHAGAKALQIKPSTAGQTALVWLGPKAFQPLGTNPSAWDDIPTTADGQSWSASVSVWLPTGSSVSIRAALYSGPYATAGQAAGAPELVVGNGTWQTISTTWAVQTDNKWVGLQLVFNPTGPSWDEMPPALTWDGADPSYFWDDLGSLYVDDVQVNSPAEGSGRGVLVFSGRVTDVTASWDESVGAPVVKVSAVGFTADLENRVIGEEPWVVESAETRGQRIVSLAGLPITLVVDDTVAPILMSYRDVDAQGATGLLKEIATSVDGVLWPAVHQSLGAYLRIEDPALRASLLQLADQAGPPAVVLRTNLATDPRATRATVSTGQMGWGARWFGSAPAAGTVTAITGATDGPLPGIATYVRKTWTVPPTNGQAGDVGFIHTATDGTTASTSGRAVTAGKTYTFSSYIRHKRSTANAWSIRARWHDAAGVWLSNAQSVYVPLVANTWQRLSLTATAPPGAAYVELVTTNIGNITGIIAGDTLDGTALLMEEAGAVAPYFDGSTPDTATEDYAWQGTANASPSTVSTIQTHTIVIVEGDPDVGMNLSACVILRDPVQWVQDVTDVVTRVSVGWKVQGVDDDGLPTTTDATEVLIDAPLEASHGTRGVSVSTQLQAAADAANVAARIIGRTAPSAWRASGITIDDNDVTGDAIGIALMLDFLDGTSRIGAPVVIGDLPIWSPAGDVAGVYLEGGTYRYVGGRWVLELGVSASEGLGGSAAWDELEPAWAWNQWDPAITWNDLRGVSA